MYSPKDQLTELVRLLESKQYIFSADPVIITEKLQQEPGSITNKLHHRASRIDVDGKLAQALTNIDQRVQLAILLLTMTWFVLGFVGLFGFMQTSVVNFFYVLLFLLGFHTLMLFVWVGMIIISAKNKLGFFSSFITPSALIRSDDAITQTAIELYNEQLHYHGMKWYIARISHQFWLASLMGMLVSLILLLLVKNYHFVWETTLLQQSTIVQLVNVMSWLPSMVGFPTPTAEDIILSQTKPYTLSAITSFRWAMLLIGSLVMYGIVPRLSVWLFCLIMFSRKKMTLDLKLPYYQKIISLWQRDVIDPDNSPNEKKPVAPIAQINQAEKLVVLLEYPYHGNWYEQTVGHQVKDFGIVDDRDDMDKLINYLQENSVQVLIGIPPQALPDRGSMRKLDKIASHANGGLIVQLLMPQTEDINQDIINLRQEQWENALAERQIGLVRLSLPSRMLEFSQ